MSNNDIALSFDTAEYYNLQEACDYLNRKFKTDNITPKKLLKRIYEFDLDTYIYGRGFYLMGNLSNLYSANRCIFIFLRCKALVNL
mgnify:CR=1 FL=1